MSSEMTSFSTGYFGRAYSAWNRFWFTPGDPTTLGLMRIIAGIIVVYVHLAYTRDLDGFFGKNGWVDITLAQELRKNFPTFALSADWQDPETNINVPSDPTDRTILFDYLRSLPTNREQRRKKLAFLHDLPHPNPGETVLYLSLAEHSLIWLKDDRQAERNPRDTDYRLITDEERREVLNSLTNLPTEKKYLDRIPELIQKMHPESRKKLRQEIEQFTDTLPKDTAKIWRIFAHLTGQSMIPLPQQRHSDPRTDLERTLNYVANHLPDDKAQRDATFAYMERWGIDPNRLHARGDYTWSIYFHVTDPTAMLLIHFAILAIMVMFTLGFYTRLTSVLSWMGAMCYIHRTNQVLFGLDVMMNINLFYMMIGPSGAALSLDRWLAVRRARRVLSGELAGDAGWARMVLAGPQRSVAANIVTRLFQIHFCFIYAASGFSKLKGPAWWQNTAVWTTIANPEFSPTVFGPYRWFLEFLADHRWLCEIVMTGGSVYTLALEIALPFLIWRPRLRPYMIIGGVLLHTGIATMMGLTVFSLLMMVLLMSFVPPEVVRYWLGVSKGRLFRLRGGGETAPTDSREIAAPMPVTR